MVSTSLICVGQQEGCENRRHREGRDQGTGQSISIGPRHGAKDLAFDALHGEQRNECGDRNGRREEDRFVDLKSADENEPKPVGPALDGRDLAGACRIGSPYPFGQVRKKLLPDFRRGLEIPENILDQYDREIDNDSEVHRAERQEVGLLASKHQHDDREEQGERDIGPTMIALRKSPRKIHWIRKTRRQPKIRL